MWKKYLGLMFLVAGILCGCAEQAATDANVSRENTAGEIDSGEIEAEREVFAMDTYMTLKTYGERAEEAIDAAAAEINRLDQLLSTEKEESEIYILNENGSEILSADTAELIGRAIELNRSTGGVFDITIYPLMQEWGFTTQDYKVPGEDKIKELLAFVDATRIEFDEDEGFVSLPDHVKVDLGGIAKGYTSSRIMDIYEDYGLTGGIVSLGGNVQIYGVKPDRSKWNVAVQYPDSSASSGEYLGILEMNEGEAVITSGGYERYFEQDGVTWHHILDPGTGYSADSGLTSVTVISEDGTLADALSTSLFIMGKEKALSYWKENSDLFDVILMEENGNITVTDGASAKFTSDCEFEIYKG